MLWTVLKKLGSKSMTELYNCGWNFSVPPVAVRGKRLWLMTKMGIIVQGIWEGREDEHYVAWTTDSPYRAPTREEHTDSEGIPKAGLSSMAVYTQTAQ